MGGLIILIIFVAILWIVKTRHLSHFGLASFGLIIIGSYVYTVMRGTALLRDESALKTVLYHSHIWLPVLFFMLFWFVSRKEKVKGRLMESSIYTIAFTVILVFLYFNWPFWTRQLLYSY